VPVHGEFPSGCLPSSETDRDRRFRPCRRRYNPWTSASQPQSTETRRSPKQRRRS